MLDKTWMKDGVLDLDLIEKIANQDDYSTGVVILPTDVVKAMLQELRNLRTTNSGFKHYPYNEESPCT